MKVLIFLLGFALSFIVCATPTLAASPSSEITSYTSNTLNIITLLSTALAVLFLVRGGYAYLTSAGRPDALEEAKKTIRNAIIGLVIVLAAGAIVSVLRGTLGPAPDTATTAVVELAPVTTVKPSDGLTQVLIDAVSSFIQNIVESATKPITDGVISFLTTTPSVLTNSVIRNFWLVTLGIVDSLFVLVVALLGLQVMSASSLGFDEIELKQILPRIGLAFLGANTSLFLADFAIVTCNAFVKAVLDSTGGLNHAWILDAINPATLITGTTPLITLIFLVLFLIISIVLLLMYISRLIIISLSAVLSPFVFLLWTLPKFADFAEIAVKTYLVSVFTIFVHVVVIQLASSYLTLPNHSENSLISIAVAIGLFLTLLKVPSLLMYMVFYGSRSGSFKKMGNQIMNVISTDNSSKATRIAQNVAVKAPRKVIQA